MKKIFFLSTVVLLFACKSNQQTKVDMFTKFRINKLAELKDDLVSYTNVNDLRSKNIDFIVYKTYSVGVKILPRIDDPNNCPRCISNTSIYVMWKENNNYFLQLFDNCGSFYQINLKNKSILKFADDFFDTINNERVKFHQKDKNSFSRVSHSTYKDFLISKKGNEIYNHFDVFNITTNSEEPNINYSFNQSLKVVQLNNIIEEEIKRAKENLLFRRDLSSCR